MIRSKNRIALLILVCVILTSCHSSLTEMKIPTGPFPPINYDAMFASYEPKVKPLEYGVFSSQHQLFDMDAELAQSPGAALYDCGVLGYDKNDRLVFYYFIVTTPISGIKYNYNMYVKACSIDNGTQIPFYSNSDIVEMTTTPIGGDEFDASALQLTSEFTAERGAESTPASEFEPTVSVIGTPASEKLEYSAGVTPTFIPKLTDKGDLFVYFKKIAGAEGRYDIYTYGNGRVEWYMGEQDYKGKNASLPPYEADYVKRGWKVEVSDVTPVFYSSAKAHTHDFNKGFGDPTAVTELIYVISYIPPEKARSEDGAEPDAPGFGASTDDMEMSEQKLSDEEAASELYTEGWPFYVVMIYRKDTLCEFKFDYDGGWYEWRYYVQYYDRQTINQLTQINHEDYKTNEAIGYWIPDVNVSLVGEGGNYGYALITTPRHIVFLDGQTGAYSSIDTKLSNYDRRVYKEAGNSLSDNQTLWSEYTGAMPVSYSGTERKLCLRSGDGAVRYVHCNMGRAATNALYKQYREKAEAPPSHDILQGAGLAVDPIMDAVARDNFNSDRRKELSDFANKNFKATMTAESDSSWDYAAKLFTQRTDSGYSDLDFFNPSKMVFNENNGYQFTNATAPSWQIKTGNLGVYPSVEALSKKTEKPKYVAAFVTRESGIDLYGVFEQGDLKNVKFKDYDNGGKDITAQYKGTYLVRGYHMDGAFFNIWHVGASNYLLVGFTDANRSINELDLSEALVMTATIGTKDTAEQEWVLLP